MRRIEARIEALVTRIAVGCHRTRLVEIAKRGIILRFCRTRCHADFVVLDVGFFVKNGILPIRSNAQSIGSSE